ncbi:MAG: alpha/beta fold hydrolase [Candidatus Heimdallarchaeota archaeon]|nr:alpha/beta fold hydrolase [Candidatus Heimdallarchaeota archaeon]
MGENVTINNESLKNHSSFDTYYQNIHHPLKDQLRMFRERNPWKQLTIKGQKWDYLKTTRKNHVLLVLIGATRWGEAFPVNRYLAEEYQIISPTYPEVYTMDRIIEGVNGILDHEGINKIDILGISFGGMIAQYFVHQLPEKVQKIALANTMPPIPEINVMFKLVTKIIELAPTQLIDIITKKRLYETWIKRLEKDQEFWKVYVEEILEEYMYKGWIVSQYKMANDFCENFKIDDEKLSRWPGKMLIIESDDDQVIDRNYRERLKELYPLARIHTIQNGGHMPVLTNCEEYLSIINAFLRDP